MKFIHTSDWHLGRMLYGRSLLPDQEHFIENTLLPLVDREQPDGVILAGDIYDRSVAPAAAIRLFDRTVEALAQRGVPLIAIAGNHDGADRLAVGAQLLRKNGVVIAARPQDAFSPYVLEKAGETVQLFTLPWLDAPSARQLLGEKGKDLRTWGQCAQAIVDKMAGMFLPGAAHVLVSHCFVAGSILSDSESTVFVGGSDQTPADIFAPFDYVALGHLHGPQKAGERGQYSGSPLKYSVDEEHQKKGYFQLEWDGREMARQFVPCAPLRDVRRVKGTFAHLLEAGEQSPVEDYVEIELTDSAPVLLAAERLRPFYPNLLSVLNPWMGESLTGERAARLKGQDEATVFAAFLREVCGTEPDPQDQSLFQEVLESLGESQET